MDPRYYANLMIHVINDGTVFLLPSVLPLIILEYSLSFGAAGLLSSIIPFCLGVLQTPIGSISDRFPNSLLLRIGVLVVSVGSLLAALLPSLLIPSLFLIGIGGSVYHPVGYAYTSKIVRNSGTGTALGIQSSSGDIGILAVLLTAGPLIALGGWRFVFLFWGVLGLVVFLITSLIFTLKKYGDDPNVIPSDSAGGKSSTLSLLLRREAILIMILFAALGAVQRLISTYLPTILFFDGVDIGLADSITAVLIGAGVIGGIIGGKMVDIYGAKRMTLAFFLSTSLLLLSVFFVRSIILTTIIVFLTGVVLLGIYPALYLLMREVTSTKIVGTSYGLLLSLGMLSGILSVSVGGALMELSPYFVYVLGSIIALLGTMISTRLKH